MVNKRNNSRIAKIKVKNESNTIREAILSVFKHEDKPLTAEKIYDQIIEQDLYDFNTDQPIHVVRTRLRRDCEGLTFASSNKKKYFQLLSDGSYWLKGKPIPKGITQKVIETRSELNVSLEKEYAAYFENFKENLLNALKHLVPTKFESFCKNFIIAYGFKNSKVTPATRDGGIDGFGQFTIGLTDLEVAFECKRWNKSTVGPDVVRRFRGSIPVRCVYGIIFTTSVFSNPAKKEAERKDLKPIVLMDGRDIVDFMIKNKFGVKMEKQFDMLINQIDSELV